MIKKSSKEGKETDSETEGGLSSLGLVMLVVIPLFVIMHYSIISYSQRKSENLVTLKVTSSDSPGHIRESNGESGGNYGYALKGQEFNCHFRIGGESLEIVTNNRKTKELFESIKRDDKLTLVINEEDENQLVNLYFNATLFGLSKNDDILFSPEQIRILQKKNMDSTLVVATVLEFVIFLGLIWKRIRTKVELK